MAKSLKRRMRFLISKIYSLKGLNKVSNYEAKVPGEK